MIILVLNFELVTFLSFHQTNYNMHTCDVISNKFEMARILNYIHRKKRYSKQLTLNVYKQENLCRITLNALTKL